MVNGTLIENGIVGTFQPQHGHNPILSGPDFDKLVDEPIMEQVPDVQVSDAPIRLNIGGGGCEGFGDTTKPGWTLIDRSVGKEAFPLDYADNTVEEVYASHVLEHFGHRETQAVINEWVRVLKPGGRLRVAVPNFEWIIAGVTSGRNDNYLGYMMGGQTDENDYHKSLFDRPGLKMMMNKAGLLAVEDFKPEFKDCSRMPVSLNLEGFKPTVEDNRAWMSHNIKAVMSVPRLGFQDNSYCIFGVLPKANICLNTVTGAFWGQCLERGMEEHIANGAEWILTIDYDTVFTEATLQRLAMLLHRHPEVDALAPLQVKRAEDTPLFKTDKTVTLAHFDEEVAEVQWAHFGLTLIRTSALMKMKKPWFIGEPNKDGRWQEGKTDDDIYFWREFKNAGNRVFIAPRVSVGHLQLMTTWPGENFTPFHQYPDDFRLKGQPLQSRH